MTVKKTFQINMQINRAKVEAPADQHTGLAIEPAVSITIEVCLSLLDLIIMIRILQADTQPFQRHIKTGVHF